MPKKKKDRQTERKKETEKIICYSDDAAETIERKIKDIHYKAITDMYLKVLYDSRERYIHARYLWRIRL